MLAFGLLEKTFYKQEFRDPVYSPWQNSHPPPPYNLHIFFTPDNLLEFASPIHLQWNYSSGVTADRAFSEMYWEKPSTFRGDWVHLGRECWALSLSLGKGVSIPSAPLCQCPGRFQGRVCSQGTRISFPEIIG